MALSKHAKNRWKKTGRTLGQGGQAQVFVVVDSSAVLNGEFALKVLSNVERTPRLDLEINTTKSLAQLGAPVLDIVDDYLLSDPQTEHPWYVSPIADGGDLGKVLARKPLDGNLPDALAVFSEIASAVGILHKNGIAHRDLKPPNVLIAGGKYILCDLGLCLPLATDGGTDRLTDTLERIGSLNYTPPEAFGRQVLGQQQIAFDAYALGKILYELIAGRALPGFLGPDEPDFDLTKRFPSPVYAGINMLLRELLHVDPNRRLQSLTSLESRVKQLREWVANKSGSEPDDVWRDKIALAGDALAKISIAAPIQDSGAKSECDAFSRQLLASMQASKPLLALSEQLIAAHSDSLELTIAEGTQLRNFVSGAFVRSRFGMEPLEDKSYPMRPVSENGCSATFQTRGGAISLPTLAVGALVGAKSGELFVGVGIAERAADTDTNADFVPSTTAVFSSARGDPALLQKALVAIEQATTKFTEILLSHISKKRK